MGMVLMDVGKRVIVVFWHPSFWNFCDFQPAAIFEKFLGLYVSEGWIWNNYDQKEIGDLDAAIVALDTRYPVA